MKRLRLLLPLLVLSWCWVKDNPYICNDWVINWDVISNWNVCEHSQMVWQRWTCYKLSECEKADFTSNNPI